MYVFPTVIPFVEANTDVVLVVGDHVTSLDVAQIVGEVYGKQPTLDNLGSLQDLHQKMLAEDDPQNPLT